MSFPPVEMPTGGAYATYMPSDPIFTDPGQAPVATVGTGPVFTPTVMATAPALWSGVDDSAVTLGQLYGHAIASGDPIEQLQVLRLMGHSDRMITGMPYVGPV